HDAERHIEFPAGPFAHLMRRLEQTAKFRPNPNGLFAGSPVHFLNFGVLTPCAHESFETIELVRDFFESRNGCWFIGGVRGKLELRTHRGERPLNKPTA